MNILPGRESFFHVSCLGSYRALLGGPDEGIANLRSQPPHRGILRISPTNILLTRDLAIEDAYIFTQSEKEMPNLEKEYQAYEKLNIPGKMVDTCPLPFTINGALVMNNQAQFHPLKYLRFLVDEIAKKGCQIYEQTTALKVEMGEQPKVLLHNGHRITCKYVLSCSHFPFHDEGFYFARMHPERSYVVAALTEKELSGGMYINAETPTRSIRYTPYNGQNLILFSGEHHKTGQGVSTMKYFENLKTYAENAFGVKQFIYRWSAQDYSTLDKVPYIGYVMFLASEKCIEWNVNTKLYIFFKESH